MTPPKIKPCKKCNTDEHIGVYKYENGVVHVECDGCHYLGAGSGSVIGAIRLHNAGVAQKGAA